MLQKVPATSRQGLLLVHFKHSEVKGGGGPHRQSKAVPSTFLKQG